MEVEPFDGPEQNETVLDPELSIENVNADFENSEKNEDVGKESLKPSSVQSFENSCNQNVEALPTNSEKAQKQVTKRGNSEQNCNSPVS